jgi:hypothetical protein
MPTIRQLTSAGNPFPDYATMATNQHRYEYAQDQQRFVPPAREPARFRDLRTPCAYAKCPQMTPAFFCSPACEAAFLAQLDRWEAVQAPLSPASWAPGAELAALWAVGGEVLV